MKDKLLLKIKMFLLLEKENGTLLSTNDRELFNALKKLGVENVKLVDIKPEIKEGGLLIVGEFVSERPQ